MPGGEWLQGSSKDGGCGDWWSVQCNPVVRRCARGRCVLFVLHTVWISCIVCRMHTAGLVYACVMVACLGYSHQQHRIGVACGAAVVCCRSLERVAHSQGDSVSLYVVISHPELWFTRPSWIVFAQSWFHLPMPNWDAVLIPVCKLKCFAGTACSC